ncbi:MAG: hypothetical protein LBG73_00170, partial [Spirochaetaceae bacterium]|nr:hypothetical protein [Spirochaetaceae bacterium]
MQKRFVKAGMFRNSIAMLAVLSVFAACSGLLQDTDNSETAPTAQEAQAIEKHGAVIRIPLTTASASRAVYTGNIGLSASDAKEMSDYFEAYLKNSAGQTYFGSAQAGVDYLIIGVIPGTYSVLVLAGTGANGDVATGEKVLLGVGSVPLSPGVTAVAGKVTTVNVTMTALTFTAEIGGVPKGQSTQPGAAVPVPIEYDGSTTTDTLFYAQFAKAGGTADMWANVDMTVTVKIKNLGAIGTWIGTTPPYITANAKIRPLDIKHFAMGPKVFANGTMPNIVTGTGTDTVFTFTLDKSEIPTSDAAGAFFFNVILPDPSNPTIDSHWNIRNRLLYSAGGYYGGGIAFLFGNAGTTWVHVIPNPWTP